LIFKDPDWPRMVKAGLVLSFQPNRTPHLSFYTKAAEAVKFLA
jgi:hypothetical protein